jgi:hypothetical protein
MGNIKGVKAVVAVRCCAREGVAIILNETMWSTVRYWRAVSSRIVWVRLKCVSEKWVMVSAYGPGSE